MWLQPENWRSRTNLPVPVTFTRFAAPLCVLSFGIVFLVSTVVYSVRRFARFGRRDRVMARSVCRRARRRFCRRCLHDLVARRKDHEHIPAFDARLAFDDGDLRGVGGDSIEKSSSVLLVGDLATAEHDGHFHLVTALQQPLGGAELHLVVVLLDLRAEFDFLEFHMVRFLARFFVAFALFVLEFAEVGETADGRDRVRRDLDEVDAALAREREGLEGRHDSQLSAVVRDDADLWCTDLLIDAQWLANLVDAPS